MLVAHGQDHIVAAFDLGDLFTSRQVRDRLQKAESLAGKEVDLDGLTKLITSMKGVTFTVQATDRLSGTMRVDFGESPSQFKEIAKAVMFEALETNGMMLDDEIKNWALAVEAKALTLKGRLSRKGLRLLTNLIPFPAETLALTEASPKPGQTGPESAGCRRNGRIAGHRVEKILPAHQPAHRYVARRCQECRVAKARAEDGRQGGA